MSGSIARILPPTAEQIEIAREELRAELAKSENQPIEEMRDMDVVFAEKRKKLEELLSAKV